MAIKLNDLICSYSNALDLNTCRSLIDVYENKSEHYETYDNTKLLNFTQLNFTNNQNTDNERSLHEILVNKVLDYKEEYYNFVDNRVFPVDNHFEHFTIKKYNADGYYNSHVDVFDHSSSRRYLCFLFYLNDVIDGGETIFADHSITPEVGKLLVFPPLWTFPYKEVSPINTPKYILTTYLHYI